jgi:hypothetical protein
MGAMKGLELYEVHTADWHCAIIYAWLYLNTQTKYNVNCTVQDKAFSFVSFAPRYVHL